MFKIPLSVELMEPSVRTYVTELGNEVSTADHRVFGPSGGFWDINAERRGEGRVLSVTMRPENETEAVTP